MSSGAPLDVEQVSPPRAELHVDIAAYRSNLAALRTRVGGDTQLWAVVKADAYGHGMALLAQEAIAAGARRLCVATLSEARHLRRVEGIRAPMLVMGPLDPANVRRVIELDVSFAVVHAGTIDALATLAAAGELGGRRVARVHLKVDTGMGRWGVPYAEAIEHLDRLRGIDGVEVEGVMTHFATADDEEDDFFETQLARFTDVVDAARERVPHVIAHAANSAATLRDPRAHFDAVRCGVATYGLDPMQADAARHGLTPVLSVRSHVADVRELQPGESTGYERTFIAQQRVLVAEVPIGYADGMRRSIGAGAGVALVRGIPRAVVGNVSMDHLSLLVAEDVRRGDVVTLIGSDGSQSVTAEDHARWAGTINYEITCGMADEPRLLRAHSDA